MKKILITIPFLFLAAACNKQTAQVQPAQNQPAQTSPSAQVQQQAQATSYEAVPDMSGWKVYNNAKYGFSFSYPSDYTLKENQDNIVLSNANYVLTFTNVNDTIRNQMLKHYSLELNSMTSYLPIPADNSSLQAPRLYRFSYFTGDASTFNRQYIIFSYHTPHSVDDPELGAYHMITVDAQGNSSVDNDKAAQEGITNMDIYAYQPDFILATLNLTK